MRKGRTCENEKMTCVDVNMRKCENDTVRCVDVKMITSEDVKMTFVGVRMSRCGNVKMTCVCVKMRGCENVKMVNRTPLLEEPFVHMFSGKRPLGCHQAIPVVFWGLWRGNCMHIRRLFCFGPMENNAVA